MIGTRAQVRVLCITWGSERHVTEARR